MWGPTYEPEPIEKIRKPQWTVENTRHTQEVVTQLRVAVDAYQRTLGTQSNMPFVVRAMREAIERLCALDPRVK